MARPTDAFRFNPDLADAVDPAPVLFDRLKCPCSTCGDTLINEEYAFFPSSVFIRGVCLRCGPRTAMFAPMAPETPAVAEQQHHERIAAELTEIARDMDTRHRFADYPDHVEDFLAYLRSA